MKDNMVQELLLKALLGQTQNAAPITANSQRQTTSNSMLDKREILQSLLKSLYLNNAQKGQNSNVNNVKKSIDNKQVEIKQKQEQTANKPVKTSQVFEEFIGKNPDFFGGREILFEYLNSGNIDFDIEELDKIAQITKKIEEEAIKRFCAKNPKYAQFLTNENSKLLNKLEKSAQEGLDGNLKSSSFFSAQDIDKMSTDEFLKHKDEIDAQILNLIKNS